jgi:hypothetical protein
LQFGGGLTGLRLLAMMPLFLSRRCNGYTPHHIDSYVPVRGDQSSHIESISNENSCLAQAWGLGRRHRWDCDGCYWRFSQLGWTTSGKAELLAQERASTAVVAALVPFCIAKAQQDPDKAIFAKFQAETSSYSRSDMVIKAGWATVGGETSPDNALARACSEKLSSAKTS